MAAICADPLCRQRQGASAAWGEALWRMDREGPEPHHSLAV